MACEVWKRRLLDDQIVPHNLDYKKNAKWMKKEMIYQTYKPCNETSNENKPLQQKQNVSKNQFWLILDTSSTKIIFLLRQLKESL